MPSSSVSAPPSKIAVAAPRRRLALAVALGALLCPGCVTPSLVDPVRTGPFFTPVNHSGDAVLPVSFRRVVLLPVCSGGIAPPEAAASFDEVFAAELQRQNRFEVVTLSREDCRQYFHAAEFSSTAALPADFMAVLRREFEADGVLFVDLTVFQPYRPVALGIRAKLATTAGPVRLLWSFDNVFPASDPAVANSARRHFLDSNRGGVPVDFSPAVLQSPSRFAAYVAAAAFATLPPVPAAPAAKSVAPAR